MQSGLSWLLAGDVNIKLGQMFFSWLSNGRGRKNGIFYFTSKGLPNTTEAARIQQREPICDMHGSVCKLIPRSWKIGWAMVTHNVMIQMLSNIRGIDCARCGCEKGSIRAS